MKKNVVILSHVPWLFGCDYVEQMAKELNKRVDVTVFILDFPSLKNLIVNAEKRKQWMKIYRERRIKCLPTLGILPFQRFKPVMEFNIWLNFLFFRLWHKIKYGQKRPIFWAFSYEVNKVSRYLNWGRLVLYDRVDHPSSIIPNEDRQIRKKDKRFIDTAGLVIVNSPYAHDYVRNYTPDVYLMPWGFAEDIFEKKIVVNPEVEKISRPRLGLVGHLDHRIDLELVYGIASKNKNWQLIFVGDIIEFDKSQSRYTEFKGWIAKLKSQANVNFLGEKNKEDIPGIISGFDVCLICYDDHQDFVRGCNPMKLYEYFALGKPVVSTAIKAVSQYVPYVKIARTVDDFSMKIADSLKEEDKGEVSELRRKIALVNSWQVRTEKILNLIATKCCEK
jgi:glycosyltransferase involved in cell wall biosynthesis